MFGPCASQRLGGVFLVKAGCVVFAITSAASFAMNDEKPTRMKGRGQRMEGRWRKGREIIFVTALSQMYDDT